MGISPTFDKQVFPIDFGGFGLSSLGRKSVFYSVSDPSIRIILPGNFRSWRSGTWMRLIAELKRRGLDRRYPSLVSDLWETARELERKRPAVVNLDRSSDQPLGEHRILVRYSRAQNFIEVSGWTFLLSDRLRELGFRFQGGRWRREFDRAVLRRLVKLSQRDL